MTDPGLRVSAIATRHPRSRLGTMGPWCSPSWWPRTTSSCARESSSCFGAVGWRSGRRSASTMRSSRPCGSTILTSSSPTSGCHRIRPTRACGDRVAGDQPAVWGGGAQPARKREVRDRVARRRVRGPCLPVEGPDQRAGPAERGRAGSGRGPFGDRSEGRRGVRRDPHWRHRRRRRCGRSCSSARDQTPLRGRVEAHAVVVDFEFDHRRRDAHPQADGSHRPGVLDDVLQRLDTAEVERSFDVAGRPAVDLHVDVDREPARTATPASASSSPPVCSSGG